MPDSDLDDHRHQPEALPRVDGPRHGSRRGTLTSIVDNQQPDLGPPAITDLHDYGPVARDFEHAIADDDSIRSGQSGRSRLSAMRAAHGPIVARRSTFRRPHPDVLPRSRGSSRSRSTSPPNSVDAFANPQRRRGRAGTITSQVSASNLSLQRTISSGTHPRRKNTLSEHVKSPEIRGEDGRSRRSSVEDDVCFPPPEEDTKTYTIDFEELEEFVAHSGQHQKTPAAHPFTSPNGNTHFNCRIFNDLRHDQDKLAACDSGAFGAETINEKINVDVEPKKSEQTTCEPQMEIERAASRSANINRWTFFSSEIDETIHAPELGGLLMPHESFRDIFELGPEGGVWWLDMLNPSEEEVIAICKAFGVHPLTREDITTQETREKVELFRSYYFVCFRSFYQEAKDSEMEPINIYAAVFREGLLTFSFCPNPHAANVRKRIGRLRDYVNLSADWICYALIDEIVDAFGPIIRDVEHEADAIEDMVFIARFEDSRQILRQLGDCRKKTMSLLRLLGGKADVIKGFAKRCNEQYSIAPRGDVGLYLSDVQDHVVTMMSNLAHFENLLSRSHSNYLAQISLDNIAQGNKSNALLGKVTLIASILVPLNLIAGLFGMNVPGKSLKPSSSQKAVLTLSQFLVEIQQGWVGFSALLVSSCCSLLLALWL